MNRFIFAFLAALLVATTACQLGDSTVSGSDFDQSCSEDSDCIPAYLGDLCKACLCDNGALNQSERDAYHEARSGVKCFRDHSDAHCACAATEAYCDQGRCALRRE